MNERTDIMACKRYSVFKDWDWRTSEYVWAADGRKTQHGGGSHSSFMVRTLGLVWKDVALCVDFYGALHEIPLHAFGDRVPDTEFLPGAGLAVAGRGMYTVEVSLERDEHEPERYKVRNDTGTVSTWLVRRPEGWLLGAGKQPKKVRVMYRGVEVRP